LISSISFTLSRAATVGAQHPAQLLSRHGVAAHATTFVIASPEARREIARREMLDHQWISDHWWSAAVASGLFHVGNHSWDHLSPR
jgi:peptidoglycan/xylan/chitin deacetylase (PgdA/CDA1 family)